MLKWDILNNISERMNSDDITGILKDSLLDTLLTQSARKTGKYLIGQKIKTIIKQR